MNPKQMEVKKVQCQKEMASRSIILFLSLLLSTLSFGKPSWKLVEVEDQAEGKEEDLPEKKENQEAGDEKDPDVEDDQDGKDYRRVIK